MRNAGLDLLASHEGAEVAQGPVHPVAGLEILFPGHRGRTVLHLHQLPHRRKEFPDRLYPGIPSREEMLLVPRDGGPGLAAIKRGHGLPRRCWGGWKGARSFCAFLRAGGGRCGAASPSSVSSPSSSSSPSCCSSSSSFSSSSRLWAKRLVAEVRPGPRACQSTRLVFRGRVRRSCGLLSFSALGKRTLS